MYTCNEEMHRMPRDMYSWNIATGFGKSNLWINNRIVKMNLFEIVRRYLVDYNDAVSEVKKRQQRVLMILDSKNVEYETIDITEPGKEMEKEFMQSNGIARDSKYPLPPQIFNEDEYCGDYEDFDLANEMDELEEFLKVEPPASGKENVPDSNQSEEIQENGNTTSREPSTDKEAAAIQAESVEERTTLPSENVQSDEPKSIENDGETKPEEDTTEHTEENVEKNEEKSGDQEKEE